MSIKSIYITLILFNILLADQRSFINTYEKKMLKKGESELEIHLTNEYPDVNIFDNANNTTLKLQYEFEIGMTDNLEMAFYNTLIQEPNGSLKFDEYKMRLKTNLFNNNTSDWVPLFYLELKGDLDFKEYTIEQKFIFTKYFDKLNFSLNTIIELENEKINDEWEREIETELALGLSYQLHKRFAAGIDMKISEYATYAGPVFAHGGEDKYWTLGLMRKIDGLEEKPNLLLQSIMGFHF